MSMSIINRERVVVRGITWWNGAYTEKILSDPSLMPTITSHPHSYVILGYLDNVIEKDIRG